MRKAGALTAQALHAGGAAVRHRTSFLGETMVQWPQSGGRAPAMAGTTPGLLRDSRPEHQIPAGGGAAAAASAHRSRGGPTIQQPQPRTAVRGCDQKELSV